MSFGYEKCERKFKLEGNRKAHMVTCEGERERGMSEDSAGYVRDG